MPFVKDSAIPQARNEYVCWIDIMGTKSKMENSVNTCAIFMLKFHASILDAIQKKKCVISVYPVMDGVYITSTSINDLQTALFHIFSELGDLFLSEDSFYHQFLVKAAIAYGPVIHGKDIDDSVNNAIASDKNYKNSLLLGLPMIQAITGEQKAPPFGVYVHESARTFHPTGETAFSFKWWKWFLLGKQGWNKDKTKQLSQKIEKYFDNCKKQSMVLEYPSDRIDVHKQAATEYFLQI